MAPALEAQSLNCWTAREVQQCTTVVTNYLKWCGYYFKVCLPFVACKFHKELILFTALSSIQHGAGIELALNENLLN